MVDDADLTSATFPERVTLLGIAYLSTEGEVPAHAGRIVETCTWRFDEIGRDVLGKVSEADVTRALNRLEAQGVVRETDAGNSSPVGKGRPRYALTVDASEVLDAFDDDDRLATLVDDIRDDDVRDESL